MKMIAGDAKWTDYVLEGRVMLKSGTRGNAGLVFRVNDAGPGHDQMRGYYVGLGTRKLYLGKMHDNWQPLAEFDLDKPDCEVRPGVWNQIRGAAEGPRIRVWLNRMHPSAGPDRGLRIDITDRNEPILWGQSAFVPTAFRPGSTTSWRCRSVCCRSGQRLPVVAESVSGPQSRQSVESPSCRQGED